MSERTVAAPSESEAADRPAGQPLVRVVRGNPTPEEIAALVVALLTVNGTREHTVRRPRSTWADPAHAVRRLRQSAPGSGSRVTRSWRQERQASR